MSKYQLIINELKTDKMNLLDEIKNYLRTSKELDFKLDYKGINIQGFEYFNYVKSISPAFLGVFDKMQLSLFEEDFIINRDSDINLMFFRSIPSPAKYEIKEVVNKLYNVFGHDSDGFGEWNNQDSNNFNIGIFGRFWDITPEGISLNEPDEKSIMFYLTISPINEISMQDSFYLSINRANLLM
jgi:hypothetical protein